MDGHGSEIFKSIMQAVLAAIVVCALVFLVSKFDGFLNKHISIKTTEPIIPELEITVKNNVVDTIYVYRDIEN